ncbi:class I SAM-dependent methyltransferase [Balneola sp. MJW-20]|uniref:class I SAM-dependent methyltransferase n=1 Tax=Gracilimonas aurantiaca TaxID=3234185 RepID=UPI0034662402
MGSTTELFTEKSEAYAKYRSGYPQELINEIVNPFVGSKTIKAADIGAGTGISSRLLADAGCTVTAVEPNQAMAEAAADHQGVEFKIQPAETTGLPDSSMDIVSSFQAFHWFNFAKSLAEFNRVLKKDGKLALVWSYWNEEDPFTKKYIDLISNATNKNPDSVSPYDGFPSGFIKKWRIRFLWKFKTLPYFKEVRRHRYIYTEEMNEESMIGLALSQSYLVHEGKLWDELCDKIRDLAAEGAADGEPARFSYKVNAFTAKPVK